MKHSSAYTLECNGRLGRGVMEAQLQESGRSGTADTNVSSSSGASNGAGAGGRVLIGHSLGAACAAAEVIASPEVGCHLGGAVARLLPGEH